MSLDLVLGRSQSQSALFSCSQLSSNGTARLSVVFSHSCPLSGPSKIALESFGFARNVSSDDMTSHSLFIWHSNYCELPAGTCSFVLGSR